MKPFRTNLLNALLAVIPAVFVSTVSADPLLMGYWMNSSRYASGASYTPDMIPAEIKEIVYAFAQVGSCAPIEGDTQHPDRFATEIDPAYCNSNPNPGYGLSGEQDWLLHSTDPGSDYTWAQWNNVGWGGGFVAALDRANTTRAHVVLSMGGWSLSAALREVFKSDKRDAFIDSVIDFLVRAQAGTTTNKKFAGVDIDWEPNGNMWTLPAAQSWNVTVSASDLQNYLDFLTALKQRMTQEKQKGTFENNYVRIAVTANPKVIKDVNTVHPGYWAAIANVVDSLNAMTYDYNGPWGALGTSGFNSPLFDDPAAPQEQQSLTIQETVAALISVGVPKNKFGIGTAAYARAYQLSSNNGTGPYQAWNGACTSFDDPNGVIVNRSIYRGINQSGTTSNGFNFLDPVSFHAYPTAGPNYSIAWKGGVSTSGLQCLITFDDAASAARKMHYAADQNLANFMLWEVSQDVRAGDTLVTGQPVDLTKHSVIYGLGHYTNYPK